MKIFKDENPKYLAFFRSRTRGIDLPKRKWQFWK
jgi:hypothetical protein